MSATTASARSLEHVRLSFGGLLRSEWIKLRTLRSTVWCFGLLLLLTVGFGVLLALTGSAPTAASMGPGAAHDQLLDQQRMFTVQVATLGVNFTQLISVVLGVLIIGGEYSTGMIRSTLTAAPGRWGAYFAKVIVLGVSTFVVSAVALGITAVTTAPILAAKGVDVHFWDGDILVLLLGGAGYLALIAMLAFTLGTIVRNTAGGLATAFGLTLVLPIVLSIATSLVNKAWLANIAAFLPSNAGGKMFSYLPESLTGPGRDGYLTLDAGQGALVLAAWVVVLGILGAILLKRRDA